ncbi:MAG: hypothetical protein ACSLFQ_05990 [Thermoanaerobaculia bacterium]
MRKNSLMIALALLATALPTLGQRARLESGPTSPLSANPVYGPAPGAQRIKAIVPTPEGWMTLWTDDDMRDWSSIERRFVATRLRPDGAPIDTTGIRLGSDLGHSRVALISDSNGARVFWAPPGTGGFSLHTATISDDGELSASVFVGEFPGDAVSTTLLAAAAGSRIAVLLDRYVMIIEGTRLVRTVDLGGFGDVASIVAAGSHFVVSWVAAGDILMRQTLDLEGNVGGPAGGTGVAFPARLHALATDGSSALLAWGDGAGLRLSVIDPETGDLTATSTLASAAWAWPHAVWTGSSYLVTWPTYGDGSVLGVHVSADGMIVDAEPRTLYEGVPTYYEIAARGSDAMMLFETGSCIRFTCETEVLSAPLGGDPIRDGTLISAAARIQSEPVVASDGTGFLTLWREGPEIFVATTTDRSRAPLPPIALADVYGYGSSVASTGNGYLATWIAFRNGTYFIEGAALTSAGEPLPQRTFSFHAGSEGPHILSTGASPDMYLIVWRAGSTLQAVRVHPAGELLDTVPIALRDDELPWSPPSIAFDGIDFVVSYLSATSGPLPEYLVLTQRVSTSGVASFDRVWVTGEPGTIQHSSMACGGETCLVVWTRRIDPYGLQFQLFGIRFRAGGEPIDSTPAWIDFPDVMQNGPAVSWDGSRFVVTWSKYIGDTGPERVEARTVRPSGPVDRVYPDLLFERDPYYAAPVTTCNREGRCVFVGQDSADDTTLGRTTRLFKRFFGEARHRPVKR